MKSLSVLALLLVGVGVSLVLLAQSAGSRSSCLAGMLGAFWELADAAQREATLDAQRQACSSHSDAREEILADLRANRIGLLEAARRFGELNQQMGDGRHTMYLPFRGRSQGERLCRQVIQWIKLREPDPPSPRDFAFRRGLEFELEALVRRDGEVRLSGPSRGNGSRTTALAD